MRAVESKLDLQLTTDTLYFALTGKLRGVYCENLGEIEPVITRPHCNKKEWILRVWNMAGT